MTLKMTLVLIKKIINITKNLTKAVNTPKALRTCLTAVEHEQQSSGETNRLLCRRSQVRIPQRAPVTFQSCIRIK